MSRVRLDLNNPLFQEAWFALERDQALAVLATLRKLRLMDWDPVYRDKGLRWELIQSRTGPGGQRIYSVQLTRRARAVAFRDAGWARFLTLHADHDTTYEG